MRRHVFACVDCNNFYVSCERVFDAKLSRRAVVVLSNNDGCVISRSEEAKALGVRMGAPYFRVRALCEREGVAVLSSNYALYGDLSRRVMETLAEFTPELDPYSIDEAFLNLSHLEGDSLAELAREVRARVLRWTGVPVAVGVAPTKTLAKLGATLAKRSAKARGVVNLLDARHADSALARTAVGDVWNVGPRLARRLTGAGIETAAQLRGADARAWRRRTSVALERVIMELRGVSCLPLSLCQPARKSAVCSRSFGRPVESLAELREAVAYYATRAAEKIRRAGLAAGALVVFVSTSRFGGEPQYSNSAALPLGVPSSFTPELIRCARLGLGRIFRDGLRYKKAGVMLLDLAPAAPAQVGMFDEVDRGRAERLMRVVDAVNARMGAETLRFAASGYGREWKMLREHCSPRYTTNWDELLLLRS
ncbi:MAG: Y-family DNA polymerase [Acidobacteria bacterium]|nr:Y-family DNA polymerase [Acidobacteriota bacterium]MCA1643153.1 Y-family DNA polymerase [Acidobacteriota bacterium]